MKKFVIGIICVGIIILIAYILNKKTYPIEFGISFSKGHAISLGLDWKETYTKMLKELKPKYIRIAATWKETQLEPEEYNYSNIDWQMDEALKYNAKVLLVVGQKAPRWPECHVPDWIDNYSDEEAAKHLFSYIEKTVNRYKNHKALEMWQVENEPFIEFTFGECERYQRNLVEKEIDFVKKQDEDHKILVTDSGELGLWYKAAKAGDYFGTTLYRIVRTPKGRIWTYDWFPAIAYRAKVLLTGVDINKFFIAELQAEPWFTGAGAEGTSIDEQEKTMNPKRLKKHIEYTRHMGASRAYLWGVEWWYYMNNIHKDSRYLDIVRDIL
jgi:hypothetical protein